jgi:hypothetical protein
MRKGWIQTSMLTDSLKRNEQWISGEGTITVGGCHSRLLLHERDGSGACTRQ